MKTLYTEKPAQGSWNSITGNKYTFLDENYRGPYRKSEGNGFVSNEDDCKPMYLDLKVDVDGPLYESPSTIADRINAQLNSCDVYGAAENTKVKGEKYQETYLPSLTDNLMKVKRVNGYDNPVYDDDWAKGLKRAMWKHSSERLEQMARYSCSYESRFGIRLQRKF